MLKERRPNVSILSSSSSFSFRAIFFSNSALPETSSEIHLQLLYC